MSPLTSSRAKTPGPTTGTSHVRTPAKVLGKLRQDFLALPLYFFFICGERGRRVMGSPSGREHTGLPEGCSPSTTG